MTTNPRPNVKGPILSLIYERQKKKDELNAHVQKLMPGRAITLPKNFATMSTAERALFFVGEGLRLQQAKDLASKYEAV